MFVTAKPGIEIRIFVSDNDIKEEPDRKGQYSLLLDYINSNGQFLKLSKCWESASGMILGTKQVIDILTVEVIDNKERLIIQTAGNEEFRTIEGLNPIIILASVTLK
jgi:hypothetical protein